MSVMTALKRAASASNSASARGRDCTLVLPDEVERWSLTTLRGKVVKIGAKVITHTASG